MLLVLVLGFGVPALTLPGVPTADKLEPRNKVIKVDTNGEWTELIDDPDGTVLSTRSTRKSLSESDRNIVRILYDPRLQPGMTRAEAMPIVREIAAELEPPPSAARPAAEPDSEEP